MLRFARILCPIDFSDTSTRALSYAAALARSCGARLDVLHVVRTPGWGGSVPAEYDDASGTDARHELEARIDRAIAAAGGDGLQAMPIVETGRPSRVIADQASGLPADLLVLGTHGHGGFNRLMLGSVTEKVLRQVACPVLTVPPGAVLPAGAPVAFDAILCPLDFSASSLAALQCAVDLARQAKGRVTALHVLEYMDPDEQAEPSPFDPCRADVEASRSRRHQMVDRAAARLHESLAQVSRDGCEVDERTVAADRAYKAILRQAEALQADVIVMGAQGAGGLELMVYGSNTQHVLRAAACPVLTVKA